MPRSDLKVPPEPVAVVDPEKPEMSTEIANRITTRAPLSRPQLVCAVEHFLGLEALLRLSGPFFTNARRDAARAHNTALDRLRAFDEQVKQPEPEDGYRALEA